MRVQVGVLAMVAELEADLTRARTREGMAVAKTKGRLRVKSSSFPKHRKRTWFPYRRVSIRC